MLEKIAAGLLVAAILTVLGYIYRLFRRRGRGALVPWYALTVPAGRDADGRPKYTRTYAAFSISLIVFFIGGAMFLPVLASTIFVPGVVDLGQVEGVRHLTSATVSLYAVAAVVIVLSVSLCYPIACCNAKLADTLREMRSRFIREVEGTEAREATAREVAKARSCVFIATLCLLGGLSTYLFTNLPLGPSMLPPVLLVLLGVNDAKKKEEVRIRS